MDNLNIYDLFDPFLKEFLKAYYAGMLRLDKNYDQEKVEAFLNSDDFDLSIAVLLNDVEADEFEDPITIDRLPEVIYSYRFFDEYIYGNEDENEED